MQAMQAMMQQGIESAGEAMLEKPWPARVLEMLPPSTSSAPDSSRTGGLAPERVAPLQPQLAGARGQLAARSEVKFVEHVLHMVRGGFLGDHQRLGHLAIRQPARDQAGDL